MQPDKLDRLAVGQERYGSRQNAIDKCGDCGHPKDYHNKDGYCRTCLKTCPYARENDGDRGVGSVCTDCERGRHGGCGAECECSCGGTKKARS